MSEDKPTYGMGMESNLPAPVVTLEQWASRRGLFNEWVNKQLRQDIDFGKIPGTDKPTLLKPGAEKILQFYGCAVLLDAVERQQDPQTGYLYVEFMAKAASVQTGQIIGMGVGACSSYESRYRYRWEWWNKKGIPPDQGGGWEEYTKKNGVIVWRRRVENRDLIDQWNTVIKIAKKRALVDLALTISGASEKFTQDTEDTDDHSLPTTEPEQSATSKSAAQQKETRRAPASAPPPEPPSDSAPPSEEAIAMSRARRGIAMLKAAKPQMFNDFWLVGHIKKHYTAASQLPDLRPVELETFAWYCAECLAIIQGSGTKEQQAAALETLKVQYDNKIKGFALPEDAPLMPAGEQMPEPQQ